MRSSRDSFRCRTTLPGTQGYVCMSIVEAERNGAGALTRLPYSLRVLAEHLLRHEDGEVVRQEDILALGAWPLTGSSAHSVGFMPARVLMQDAAGLPVLADLAALDEEVRAQRGTGISLKLPAALVVDHAVEVDASGTHAALSTNLQLEFERHGKRYEFLKWAAQRFPNLRIAPPGIGICHQLNLEVLSDLVSANTADNPELLGFDSVLGTDSHTTMVNGLSVFGWGVGGIEATAALLGEPTVMRIPDVIGVRLTGELKPGVQAADLALTLTAALREHDLVQRVVEFCGPALGMLSVPDRASIANMAPEYGATMAYFPPDAQTLAYLRRTGRPREHLTLVERFLRAQGMYREASDPEPRFTKVIDFDLGSVVAAVAGPSLPQQCRTLSEVPATIVSAEMGRALTHGAVVLAAITSCTNTSNPEALVTAGLLARNAVLRGLRVPAWVKTSFAPGSRVASELLSAAGLQRHLDTLGFHVVGHGCTTCMGNSGPLLPGVEARVKDERLSVAAVLSGNRNFEGRIHPAVRSAYLASPALVVAYALAGNLAVDLSSAPLGNSPEGAAVRLSDIWPAPEDVHAVLEGIQLESHFAANRRVWQLGSVEWDALPSADSAQYPWEGRAGYIRRPPFLETAVKRPLLSADIVGARPLLILGDAITTDHISPVSRISATSTAGRWLQEQGIAAASYGTFSARRLNHEVMLRGGFANPRLRNHLLSDTEGGFTRLLPDGDVVPVHEAAQVYAKRGVPTIVIAGARYGGGSARDWAAKVTRLLGVRAVIANSFERIHRANLLAFGILPLETEEDLGGMLTGDETLDLGGLPSALRPGGELTLTIRNTDGALVKHMRLACRIDTVVEAEWLTSGGMLGRVLDKLLLEPRTNP
ncbi:aconitate hydratase AcnA [Cupriavidus basilensis]|nr:aconitate hydratase AcnA [Cupriavidus basilensis]